LAGLAAESLAISGNTHLVLLLVGAVVGAIVAALVLDWAIIILSSLMGAGLVAEGLALAPPWSAAAFVVLALIGVLIQGRTMTRRPIPPPPRYVERPI
jgi:hypothetical protein